MKTTSLAIHSTIRTLPVAVLATVWHELLWVLGMEILEPRLRNLVLLSPLGNGAVRDLTITCDVRCSAKVVDELPDIWNLVGVHADKLSALSINNASTLSD